MPSNQPLLEQMDSRARIILAEARRKAMRGQIDAALDQINDTMAQASGNRVFNLVGLALLKAELLLLDGRADRAMEVFDQVLVPCLAHVSPGLSIVIEHNRNDVQFALLTPAAGRSFSQLVDRQHLVGLELTDTFEITAADEAAVEGKHFEALPAFWRELTRTYLQACWTPHRWAAKRIARECLHIGLLHEAAYHVMVAQDDKLATEIGDRLLARRDAGIIRSTVAKLMAMANLQSHFDTACEILTRVGDGIADDQVDLVATWLLRRCSLVPVGWSASSTLGAAWQALEPVARRLSPGLARQAIAAAANHPYWTTAPSTPDAVFIARERMVKAVAHLAYAVPPPEMDLLARQTVPLAKERMQNHDYPQVINLLCHIAERGGSSVKEWIGDQLFPPGQPVTYFVGHVAANFGKPFLPSERMASAADQVARNLSLQVQRLGPEEKPEPVPSGIMTHTSQLGDGTIVVTLDQGVELTAMGRHCSAIPIEALRRLVETALIAIADTENLLANRASVTYGLMEFAGCLPHDLADHVLSTLTPLARGEIKEPTSVPPAAMTESPLNPYKIRTGTPSNLRGIALRALARIGKHDVANSGPTIHAILEDALGDLDPGVRRFAFAAAREMPKLSEATIMAVLMGTRDPDSNAAASAFAALANKTELHLTRSQWQLFLYSVKMASQSSDATLRRLAASALSRLIAQVPNAVLRAKAGNLFTSFATDICASVREAASEHDTDV